MSNYFLMSVFSTVLKSPMNSMLSYYSARKKTIVHAMVKCYLVIIIAKTYVVCKPISLFLLGIPYSIHVQLSPQTLVQVQ